MPKFFVFSDCHGFYNELKEALDNAGFDPANESHWLIGCGDYMDRGRQPQQVMEYLQSLPRCILAKGNHEELLVNLIDRGYSQIHEYHNGTAQTIWDLAPGVKDFKVACAVAYDKVKEFLGNMVEYFETKNHIFVHSFVPLKCNDDLPKYYIKDRKFEFVSNWREATEKEWRDSRWGNPFDLAEQGLLPDKTLVFGHFHTSYQWSKTTGCSEFDEDANFEPYYGDGYIGIDGCVAYTEKCNVVVIEDEFLEEKRNATF